LPLSVVNIVYSPAPAPPPQSSIFAVNIAHWFAWVVSAIPLVVLGFVRFRRRVRNRLGGCVKCGYDLTGNVSGICPECGTPCRPIAEKRRAGHDLKPCNS
jgi:hypothetical protein